MATFRKIHTTFWADTFVSELDNEKKLFYLYLLTNQNSSQCGIYEISKRQISFDLNLSIDTVSILLQYFIDTDKIKYNFNTNEIAIKNWTKYNGSTSPKVESHIRKELQKIKDRVLIQYLYSIDTHQQKEKEEEEEKEEEPLKNSNLFRKPKIPTIEQVKMSFRNNGGTNEMAEKFFNKHSSVGWFMNGSPIINFVSLIPSFIQNYNKFNNSKSESDNYCGGVKVDPKNPNSFI